MTEEFSGAVGLADFVEALRRELRVARDRGEGSDLHFDVGPVELELSLVTTKEAGPEAKVRFWVIEAGGSAKFSRQQTQRVKLTLSPVDPVGQTSRISDRASERPR
jgi:hypothetical protein